jgi:hypothetical protein
VVRIPGWSSVQPSIFSENALKILILDASGDPGRYTIELAKQGHDVVLPDITPELLKIAEKELKRRFGIG